MGLGLEGKVALVIGGTQGMGRGAANALAREGCHVAVCARNRPEGDSQADFITKPSVETVAKEIEAAGAASAKGIVGDVVSPDDAPRVVQEAHAWHGRLDILVNTVGLCEVGQGPFMADDWWERSFQSVLMSSVRVCREVVPLMVEQGEGSIVLTSAMSARHFIPPLAHYSTQKAALAHFTKDLAKEFGPKGVRTNAILPGILLNEQHLEHQKQWIADLSLPDEFPQIDEEEKAKWSGRERTEQDYFLFMNKYFGGVTWGNRFGSPTDYGNVAAFLASPMSSYVNGVLLNVDGGSEYL